MEVSLAAFLVIVFSVVDDLYREKYAPFKPRRRGHKPELADSEALTLALLGQWQKSRSESAFVAYAVKHWQEYFPRMLSQSAFNRRGRDLAGVLCQLGPEVSRLTQQFVASPLGYDVLDAVPVPLMRRCRGNRHRLFANEAAVGRGDSDHEWYYGVKLLLAVSPNGQVTGFVFGPANTEERWLAEALLRWRLDPSLEAPKAQELAAVLGPSHKPGAKRLGPTGPLLGAAGDNQSGGCLGLGDLGYTGQAWSRHWLEDYGMLLLTKADYLRLAAPPADSAKAQAESRQGRHQLTSLRQVIETVNSYLDSVLGLKFPRARSLWGLLARLGAKIAAFNLAIHFNLLSNRLTLSQFDPFA